MFLAELGLGAAFGTDVVEFHIVSPLATDYGRVSGLENPASARNYRTRFRRMLTSSNPRMTTSCRLPQFTDRGSLMSRFTYLPA